MKDTTDTGTQAEMTEQSEEFLALISGMNEAQFAKFIELISEKEEIQNALKKSANKTPEIPKGRPISDCENEDAGGKLLCGEKPYEADAKNVKARRKARADYLSSLPDDPKIVLGVLREAADERDSLPLVQDLLLVTELGLRYDDLMLNKPFANVVDHAGEILSTWVKQLQVASDILEKSIHKKTR